MTAKQQQTLDDAEVLEPEIEPEPDPDAPSAVVALPDIEQWIEPDQDWPHQWIDYAGDRLAVRKPTEIAIAGFHLSQTEYNSMAVRWKMTSMFIAKHISEGSKERIYTRLVSPDEPEYTVDTVGQVMAAVIELTTGPVGNGKAS